MPPSRDTGYYVLAAQCQEEVKDVMRIGINTLFLIPGAVGGSETYLLNLIKHLAMIDQVNEYVLYSNREN